jgi:acetolactate synthase I/II/III large subunit
MFYLLYHGSSDFSEYLRALKTIFGLPGLQLDYIFDALYDRQKEVRVMHARHEQAAAYMAFGYARRARRIIYGLYVPRQHP